MKNISSDKPNKKLNSGAPYSSWDALTQSKFIYDINKQAGTPVSRTDAYKTAEIATNPENTDSLKQSDKN